MNTTDLEILANEALATAEIYEPRTGKDLVNASLVFVNVLTPLVWDHCNTLGLTLEQRGEIMTNVGNNIRQTILLSTGIDLHDEVAGWSGHL